MPLKAKSAARRSTSRGQSASRATFQSSGNSSVSTTRTVAKARGGAPFVPAAKHESRRGARHESTADIPKSSFLALLGGKLPMRCSSCKTFLQEDQPAYPCSERGLFFCRDCAAASLVAKHRKCCICHGPFRPGEEVYQCPSDAQMFACEGCVEAMKHAAANRPASCDECKELFSAESRIFVSNHKKATYVCQRCAELRNAEEPKCCSKCHTAFRDGVQSYRCNEDGSFLCQACKDASLPLCTSCGRAIQNRIGMIGDRPFHVDCLSCSKCFCRLTDGRCFQAADGKLTCQDCRKEQLSLAVAGLGLF